MTPKQYLEFLREMHRKEEEITKLKNGDYSSSDDCFSNFRRYNEIQFLSRIYEKFCRLENLINNGKACCEDEGLEDTIMDMSNYLHLLLGFKKTNDIGCG